MMTLMSSRICSFLPDLNDNEYYSVPILLDLFCLEIMGFNYFVFQLDPDRWLVLNKDFNIVVWIHKI